jgi:hypothetical protein
MIDCCIELRYPLYLIEADAGIVAVDGAEWLLLYPSRPLAMLHIGQLGDDGASPCSAECDDDLREALRSAPNVAGFLWAAPGKPSHLMFIERAEFGI